jgi:hypothetical protein
MTVLSLPGAEGHGLAGRASCIYIGQLPDVSSRI